jgi:hypothetical protein
MSNSPTPDNTAPPPAEDKQDDVESHHSMDITWKVMSILNVCSFCEELIMAHNKQTVQSRIYEGKVVKSKVFIENDRRVVKAWEKAVLCEVPETMSDKEVTTILTCKCNPRSDWPRPQDVHIVDLIEILPEVKLATYPHEVITGVFPVDFKLSECAKRLELATDECSRLEKKLTHTQDYLLFGLPEETSNFIKEVVDGPVTTSNFPRIFQDLIFEEKINNPTALMIRAVDRYRAYVNKSPDQSLLVGAATKQGVNLLQEGFQVEPWLTFLGLFPNVNDGLRILQSKKVNSTAELAMLFPKTKDIWNEIKTIEGSLDLLIPDKFWQKMSSLPMPNKFKNAFATHTQDFIKLYKKNLVTVENWEVFLQTDFNLAEAIKEINTLHFPLELKKRSYFVEGITLKPELRTLLVSSEGWKFYDSVIRGLEYSIEDGKVIFNRAVPQTRASPAAKQSSSESKGSKSTPQPPAQSVSSSAESKSSSSKTKRQKKQRSAQSSPSGSPPKKKSRGEFLSELRSYKAEGKSPSRTWWNEFDREYPKKDRSPNTK